MTDDSELERLKRQRLAEMQKRMTAKQQSHTEPGKLDPSKVFEKVFVGVPGKFTTQRGHSTR